MRNPWEERLRSPKSRAAFTPTSDVKKSTRSREVVVKAVSYSKTVKGVSAVIHYIAKHGGKDDLGVFEQDGTPIDKDKIFEHIQDWDLLTDRENFSKKFRDASTAEKREMPDADKFYRRQSVHKVISFPVSHSQVSDDQLHAITQDYLKPFTSEGHRAVYAIHRHQARPHVHIVMTTEGIDSTLRLQREQLNRLRLHAKEIALEHGVEVEATRRLDRPKIIENIVTNVKQKKQIQELNKLKKQAAREDISPMQKSVITKQISHFNEVVASEAKESLRLKHDYFAAKIKSPDLLSRQSPIWYQRNGVEAQARILGRPKSEFGVSDIKLQPVKLPKLGQSSAIKLKQFVDLKYHDPSKARQSFLEMAAEKPKTAFWYANNRPEIFGSTIDVPANISQRDVRLSKSWRDQAISRLEAATHKEPHLIEIVSQDNAILHKNRVNKAVAQQVNRDLDFVNKKTALVDPVKEKLPDPVAKAEKKKINIADKAKALFGVFKAKEPEGVKPIQQIKAKEPEKVKPTQQIKAKEPVQAKDIARSMKSSQGLKKGKDRGREK
ncbi:relaxase/mobilization nuclease domain-containing protein [Kiloniella laminariae]|uniref:Relaxase/mobilization nuclease domain-containing protein n=1 Tax=Kiloniella laminariae TaxID=454162 RepID=A0ABT4LPS8_9PROT|nr:relaxase/mobilization nuclease domain-containing protein [Kiloniella laminariae]MCZ4283135.1 relaxase/mobilization nuclease domain-containing protein [Kiloniella laminariae]